VLVEALKRQEVAMKTVDMLTVTSAAEQHFAQLIVQEGVPGTQIRIAVSEPGTPAAEVAITFCPPGQEQVSDGVQMSGSVYFFIEEAALPFLNDATIDFTPDAVGGGELLIRAPQLKTKLDVAKDTAHLAFSEQITYLIETEINPSLAAHGGRVSLVEFVEDEGLAVLAFSGGCQGCGMANVTLKQGIEKTLTLLLPFVLAVRDVTDHQSGKNPYY
jgi:Fe/S biogenesis protein NfuA